MGDFVYYGEHSINFKTEEEDTWANTWTDWKLAPSVRPVVNPPEPKKEYVDVPGADGSLDYTEALTSVRYSNRTGSWTFLIDNGFWDWPTLYTEFMTRYQGKKIMVQLVDDIDYYYTGRIEVNAYNQNKDYSSFTINYTLDPFKFPIDSAMNRWWKWDELFSPTYFGPMKVEKVIERNILNPNKSEKTDVYIGATATMSFDLFKYVFNPSGNVEHPNGHKLQEEIHQGTIEADERNEPAAFSLEPGEVKLIRIYGNGIVNFDTGSGKRL